VGLQGFHKSAGRNKIMPKKRNSNLPILCQGGLQVIHSQLEEQPNNAQKDPKESTSSCQGGVSGINSQAGRQNNAQKGIKLTYCQVGVAGLHKKKTVRWEGQK